MNPMGFSTPWDYYKTNNYPQTLKFNKQYYDMTQKIQGINPIFLSAPWVNYKNKQLFTNMKM